MFALAAAGTTLSRAMAKRPVVAVTVERSRGMNPTVVGYLALWLPGLAWSCPAPTGTAAAALRMVPRRALATLVTVARARRRGVV
ncbi:hypothetical protein ZEAMMB73_Zm00001d036669 [Zea mays]|uniref:Uncharacterized protein n=1 Tax=Zea mays TaxID=4577 RepID=A0A1D6LQ94_MAIZE|nr:hypothetical protein ZEAMMB73_Zm00001d036669 [Zea mays]AQK81656.1 hypothetical protein ZEAMMB73_Zm00001d036669 [Zea mays]AQK81657.1 hypothetical protein ZEAMMB73_Zm00001d036669 [Zea mays]AQK81659.1 hypothetical protein ZEAMMB73_Zm00001d036669 [Zea mays]AQK81660.1 hypothetical protein ZEAMMB73_Zm00001d036669 [Zea mays]